MRLEMNTKFQKGDSVFSDTYGAGVVKAIAARLLILPDDRLCDEERDEEISYFVRFSDDERIVDEAKLHAQVFTDTQKSSP